MFRLQTGQRKLVFADGFHTILVRTTMAFTEELSINEIKRTYDRCELKADVFEIDPSTQRTNDYQPAK